MVVSIWQCRFVAEFVMNVTSRTLTAEAPPYATIIDLDRKVREFPLPEGMDSGSDGGGVGMGKGGEGDRMILRGCSSGILNHIRETALVIDPSRKVPCPHYVLYHSYTLHVFDNLPGQSLPTAQCLLLHALSKAPVPPDACPSF
ncbi:hypothetical protein DXG01_015765 [Tephrocybe rancida]|nr:hypothetical protein DXG01_015765 [Tephrocybe rancida]